MTTDMAARSRSQVFRRGKIERRRKIPRHSRSRRIAGIRDRGIDPSGVGMGKLALRHGNPYRRVVRRPVSGNSRRRRNPSGIRIVSNFRKVRRRKVFSNGVFGFRFDERRPVSRRPSRGPRRERRRTGSRDTHVAPGGRRRVRREFLGGLKICRPDRPAALPRKFRRVPPFFGHLIPPGRSVGTRRGPGRDLVDVRGNRRGIRSA